VCHLPPLLHDLTNFLPVLAPLKSGPSFAATSIFTLADESNFKFHTLAHSAYLASQRVRRQTNTIALIVQVQKRYSSLSSCAIDYTASENHSPLHRVS